MKTSLQRLEYPENTARFDITRISSILTDDIHREKNIDFFNAINKDDAPLLEIRTQDTINNTSRTNYFTEIPLSELIKTNGGSSYYYSNIHFTGGDGTTHIIPLVVFSKILHSHEEKRGEPTNNLTLKEKLKDFGINILYTNSRPSDIYSRYNFRTPYDDAELCYWSSTIQALYILNTYSKVFGKRHEKHDLVVNSLLSEQEKNDIHFIAEHTSEEVLHIFENGYTSKELNILEENNPDIVKYGVEIILEKISGEILEETNTESLSTYELQKSEENTKVDIAYIHRELVELLERGQITRTDLSNLGIEVNEDNIEIFTSYNSEHHYAIYKPVTPDQLNMIGYMPEKFVKDFLDELKRLKGVEKERLIDDGPKKSNDQIAIENERLFQEYFNKHSEEKLQEIGKLIEAELAKKPLKKIINTLEQLKK